MENLTDGELLQTMAALKDRIDTGSLPSDHQCMKDLTHAILKVQKELREREVDYGT